MSWQALAKRWRGTPLLPWFLGLALLGAVTMSCALVLVLLWAFGDVRSDSGGWTVVIGVSAVVAAGASLVTAAAVGLAAAEFDRQAAAREAEERRDRVSRWPYIRADIGFADYLHQPGFQPPAAKHIYSLSELGVPAAATAALAPISATGRAGHPLVLWLTNLQTEPLAIADDVNATVLVRWISDSPPRTIGCEVEIALAYLGPGQTTAIALVEVASSFEVSAEITAVRYRDIFGATSGDTHGAMAMLYSGGEVRNDRKVRRFQ